MAVNLRPENNFDKSKKIHHTPLWGAIKEKRFMYEDQLKQVNEYAERVQDLRGYLWRRCEERKDKGITAGHTGPWFLGWPAESAEVASQYKRAWRLDKYLGWSKFKSN